MTAAARRAAAASLDPVGFAVIGLGAMGALHARALAGLAGADLLVCCDIDQAQAAKCPSGVRFTDQLDEALAEPRLQAVVVAAPERAHRPAVVKALRRGLHVLCEKPFAVTLEDADAMIDAAAASNRLLAVAHISRFDARYRAVRAAVNDGRLGPAVHLSVGRHADTRDRDRYGGRTSLALELAIHDLDLCRWLAGEIACVFAEKSVSRDSGVEESLAATIRFRSGAVGSLDASWALAPGAGVEWEHRLSYLGREGFAHIEGRSRGVSIHSAGTMQQPDTIFDAEAFGTPAGLVAVEDAHFVACVAGHRDWPLTLEDARAALELALALDESARTRAPVELPA